MCLSWFKVTEIVLPELHEMRNAHVVSIGSEAMCALNPDCEDGYASKFLDSNQRNFVFPQLCELLWFMIRKILSERLFYYLLIYSTSGVILYVSYLTKILIFLPFLLPGNAVKWHLILVLIWPFSDHFLQQIMLLPNALGEAGYVLWILKINILNLCRMWINHDIWRNHSD